MTDQPCSSYKCEESATSPCSSDRSTPPYLQWARDLNSLLKDPNGYAIFEKFLIHELGHANELMFFYACEGMKIAYLDSQKSIKETANDADRKIKESQWAQYMKHFYHEYIVHNSRIAMPCIRSEIRLEVHNLISKVDRHLDLVILVQKEVEEVLRIRHALFVESDEYISYIQTKEGHNMAENTNLQAGAIADGATAGDALATSTASMDEARPPSRLLSTVLEESEVDSLPSNEAQIPHCHYHTLPGRLSSAAASTSVDSPYNFKDKLDPRSQVASQISLDSAPKLTQNLLKKTYQNRIQNTNGFLSNRPNEPPNPYHTTRPYKPYLTTSTQDSEIQSMSSGTNTESLKMSRSEQSRNSNADNRLNDRRFLHHVDRHAQRFPANRDNFNHIPRTKQPHVADHQSQNMLNESFRKAVFAKLEELRHQMELRRSIKENPVKAFQEYCAKIDKNANNDNEAHILDAHVSILGDGWRDSSKNSPSRSPGVIHRRDRSPLPQNITPNVINRMMTSYPSRGVASFLPPNNAASVCSTTQQSSCSRAKIDDRPHCFLPQHSQLESQNARAYLSETSLQQQQTPSTNQEPNQTGIFVTHHQPYLTSFESEMGHHQPTTSSSASQRFGAVSRYTSDDTSGFWSGFQSNESTASNALPKGKAKTIHNVATSGSSTINKSQILANPIRQPPAPDDIRQRFNQLSSPMYNGSHSALNIDNAQKTICIIYFLPNERTPFRTKFTCSEDYKIRLKDFKKLIPRKYSAAKFFFKSEDESGNTFFEDISNEDEELPLIKVNEITARIDC